MNFIYVANIFLVKMDFSNFEQIKVIYLEKCKKTLLKIAKELSNNSEIDRFLINKAFQIFLINDFEDILMVTFHDEIDTLIANQEKYSKIEYVEENNNYKNIKQYLLSKDALILLDYYIDNIDNYIYIQTNEELSNNNPYKLNIDKNNKEWWTASLIEGRIPFADMNFANFPKEEYKYIIVTDPKLLKKEEDFIISNKVFYEDEVFSDSDL